MNEPCAATFVLSSIGFNELNVFIPGLEHEAKIVSSVISMLITCVRERHYPRYGNRSEENTSCSSEHRTVQLELRPIYMILTTLFRLSDLMSVCQIALQT